MAKHKGKRSRSKRDSGLPEVENVSAATRPRCQGPRRSPAQPTRSEVVEGMRVEGNVIHLPKPGGSEESVSSRPTMRAGSGWSDSRPRRTIPSAAKRGSATDHRAARGRRGDASSAEAAEPAKVEAPEEKVEKVEEKTEAKAEEKTEAKGRRED